MSSSSRARVASSEIVSPPIPPSTRIANPLARVPLRDAQQASDAGPTATSNTACSADDEEADLPNLVDRLIQVDRQRARAHVQAHAAHPCSGDVALHRGDDEARIRQRDAA